MVKSGPTSAENGKPGKVTGMFWKYLLAKKKSNKVKDLIRDSLLSRLREPGTRSKMQPAITT